ncbi:MAG TPA: NAD(P)/FAD-dependent oxidoreductase [Acidimicrobiales bacterium]
MTRRPLRFVIIGAGFSGVLSAIKLAEAGFDDVVVYEKAGRLGGTWRENTYPGVACDVPSQLYSYSFALNPEWSHVFSPGTEILEYLEAVAERFGVPSRVRYGTEVTGLAFIDGRWRIDTSQGPDVADVVIAATGVLHHPSYPEIEGIDTFAGPAFHSARWDHSVDLAGARVGVIGTGSSAVQMTAALVDTVAELHLFQRTAQWIMPARNDLIEEEDKERYRSDRSAMEVVRQQVYDTFTGHFGRAIIDAESSEAKMIHEVCVANLERSVKDEDLRERLRPNYRAACKRLVMSPNFYQQISKPNAFLITKPISTIEPGGVRTADGTMHELDVLVFATGFRVDRFLRPIRVIGRGGLDLDQAWAKHPVAYLSVSVPEFPNLFMLNGPNGPVGNFPLIEVAELQFGYVMQLIDGLARGEWSEVSPQAHATVQRESQRVEAAKSTIWATGCRSWYLDDEGIPAAWPWSFAQFGEEMSAPVLAEYDLRP